MDNKTRDRMSDNRRRRRKVFRCPHEEQGDALLHEIITAEYRLGDDFRDRHGVADRASIRKQARRLRVLGAMWQRLNDKIMNHG